MLSRSVVSKYCHLCLISFNSVLLFAFFVESVHDLVICRLSRQSGYACGGDEVFLLCEKINKGQCFLMNKSINRYLLQVCWAYGEG